MLRQLTENFSSASAVMGVIIESITLEQGILFTLVTAVFVAVWRMSAFHKGVLIQLNSADEARGRIFEKIEKQDHKLRNLEIGMAVIASKQQDLAQHIEK